METELESEEARITVHLIVNDDPMTVRVAPNLSLLRFLRDRLRLTGAKDGCSKGHCGACTVIIDGKPRRACLVRMKDLDGASVQTIEGLSDPPDLHPLQESFIALRAFQCGFCTPGMIMAAKALIDSNPNPSDEEIRRALTQNRNLCRCTSYNEIVDAIRVAAARIASGEKFPNRNVTPSARLRKEALDIVTGRMKFADDIVFQDMLYGKIRRADYPRAEINNIDVSEAEAVEGVLAVATANDIPGVKWTGTIKPDEPVVSSEVTHYIGDSLACVFANSPEVAEYASKKIKIEYSVLPCISSIDESSSPGAPKAHKDGNLIHKAKILRGDVENAFKECEVICERTYTTPFIEQAPLEPESGFGIPEPDGGVTIMIGTQNVFGIRKQLSEILSLPSEKIRVIQLPIGGAFGSKLEFLSLHYFLAIGALKTQSPVKITLSREESILAHQKRHASQIKLKVGSDRRGRLKALRGHLMFDGGAYTSFSINVVETAMMTLSPYFLPNFEIIGDVWRTNNPPAGAMRGFATNQVAFAMESMMDELAHELGLDPIELRQINALDSGLPTVTDHVLEPGMVSIKETLQAAQKELKKEDIPKSNKNRKIGVGVASFIKNVGFGRGAPERAGAILELDAKGHCLVRITYHEMGQGVNSSMVALVSSGLNIPPEQIEIVSPDTARTPNSGATSVSRQTFMTGKAILMAAQKIRSELFSKAAEVWDTDPDNLKIDGEFILDIINGKKLPLSEFGDNFVAEEWYDPPNTVGLPEDGISKYGKPDFESRMTHWCYSCCTQVAVVEVNEKNGNVQVLKVISINDVGKAINPQAIEGQIRGGILMGLGYCLREEFIVKKGMIITDSLYKCKLPTAEDAPDIVTVILEIPHPFGPNGAKGIAEAPTIPIVPAITNAIYDAVGIRVTDLPANKERIKALLKEKRLNLTGNN